MNNEVINRLARERKTYRELGYTENVISELKVFAPPVINANVADTQNEIAAGAVNTTSLRKLAVKEAQIQDAAITNAKIADASITDAKIASLNANKIVAGSLVGRTIKTSTNAGSLEAGVVLDANGLRGYNSAVQQTVDIPTDGSSPTFMGDILSSAIQSSDYIGGKISGTIITGSVLRTSAEGQKTVISSEGIVLDSGSLSGKYGTELYGGGASYGTGALAYINNSDKKVPFYMAAEQTVADFHYFSRSAVPTGPAQVGDTCIVNGKHHVCKTAGTPGTWVATVIDDGLPPFSGDLDMDGNKVINVGTPTELTDAVTKEYVDSQLADSINNKVGFAAYRTGATDVTYTGIVVLPNTSFNYGDCYSTATGKFTAPVDGIYHFNWTCLSNDLTGRAALYRNSGLIVQGENAAKTLAATVALSAGDTVWLAGSASFPMKFYGSIAHNLFSGHLVTGMKGDKGDIGDTGVPGTNGADGNDGASIVSADFVGDDIVFTKSDTATVTLEDAVTELKGDSGIGMTPVPAETPSGTVNGSNVIFTLSNIPEGPINLFLNGVRQELVTNYTIDSDTITFVDAPVTGDSLVASYFINSILGLPGTIENLTMLQVMSALNPVGTIREFDVSTNPAELLGFGTWAIHGAGRTTVCINPLDPEFDTLGEEYGSKTHLLTGAQSGTSVHSHGATSGNDSPDHSHNRGKGNDNNLNTGSGFYGWQACDDWTGTWSTSGASVRHTHPITVSNSAAADASEAHNNIQPSIVTYRWVRTA